MFELMFIALWLASVALHFKVKAEIKAKDKDLYGRLFSREYLLKPLERSRRYVRFTMHAKEWECISDHSVIFWLGIHRLTVSILYLYTFVIVAFFVAATVATKGAAG